MWNLRLQKSLVLAVLGTFLTQQVAWAGGIPSATLKSSLDKSLADLYAEKRSERMMAGGVNMVTGAIFGGLGLGVETKKNGSAGSILGSFLVPSGLVMIGLGGVSFLVPSAEEQTRDQYAALPEKSEQDINVKIAYGEGALMSLAEMGKHKRIMTGAGLVGLGVLYVAFGFAFDDLAGASKSGLNTIFLAGGGLMGVLGAMQFFMPSSAERSYQAYQTLKRGDGSASPRAVSKEDSWSVVPLLAVAPQGMSAGFSLHF
jgi:hypothetical protein